MRTTLLLALIALLAGCGASEQQRVMAAIRASDAAWDRGDLDVGCSWMTERARRRVMADGINPGAGSCAEAYEDRAPEATGTSIGLVILSAVEESEPPRVSHIRIDGDRASVEYSDGGRTRLQKVNGRWLNDSY